MKGREVRKITRGLGNWNDGTKLLKPLGLCCVGNHIYICDSDSHFLKRTGATFLDTLEIVAGIGRSVWGVASGDALTMALSCPHGIFPGPDGALCITSVTDAVLWELRRGRLNLKMGMTGGGFVNGKLAVAKMEGPSGGYYDAKTGVTVIVDTEDCRLRLISPDGVVSSIGSGGLDCLDGSFSNCSFHEPVAICRAEHDDGNSFFVTEHCCVRQVRLETQNTSTFAGARVAGFADGPKIGVAKFRQLAELACTKDGTIFLADSGNERIRRIGPDGHVSTVAGPFTPDFKPSTSSPKGGPYGLCLTANGDLVFSQPKMRQLLVLRGIVPPDQVEMVHETIIWTPVPTLSLIELRNFTDEGAGAPRLFPLHPGFLHLAYSPIDIYGERLQQMIINANLTSEEVMEVLLAESFPDTWTSVAATNMWYMAKQCHLPIPFRESLVVKLETLLNDTPYDELWSLLHHVEVHCESNAKLGKIIAYSILIKMSVQEITELPPNMSTFAESCFEPSLLKQLRSGVKFGRPLTKLSDSHLRSRLEWLYEQTSGKKAKRSPRKDGEKKKRANSRPEEPEPFVADVLACNFELESCDGASVACHDWVLYARWPYFRFMVASGGDEWTTARKITFPSGTLSRKAVRAFVKYLYSNRVEDVIRDHEVAMQILASAQRFNLTKFDVPGTAHIGFESLISAACSVFEHPSSLKNCVEKFRVAKELGNEMYMLRTASFIAEYLDQLMKDRETSEMVISTIGYETLGKIWVWVNGGPKPSWRAAAESSTGLSP